jgi:hypothetical protein
VTNGATRRQASAGGRAVAQVAKWYVRTTADHDTHHGRLRRDGTVQAGCGLVFKPVKALRDRGPALPGYPPDADQVCPACAGA